MVTRESNLGSPIPHADDRIYHLTIRIFTVPLSGLSLLDFDLDLRDLLAPGWESELDPGWESELNPKHFC